MAKRYQKRAPIQERRKKAEQAKLEKRRAYYQAHKDKIWTIVLSVVIGLAVLGFALDYFITPGGSIRMFLGKLVGVESNMIIANNGTKKAPRYYCYGTMETPEGFTVVEHTYSNDDREKSFYYMDEEDDDLIKEIYVAGVANKTADEMLATVRESSIYVTVAEPREGVVASIPVKYLYATSTRSDNKNDEYANLTLYADVRQDSCVNINLCSAFFPSSQLPTEEEMLKEAEKILQYYRLPE